MSRCWCTAEEHTPHHQIGIGFDTREKLDFLLFQIAFNSSVERTNKTASKRCISTCDVKSIKMDACAWGKTGSMSKDWVEIKKIKGIKNYHQYRATTIKMLMYFCMRVSLLLAMVGLVSEIWCSKDFRDRLALSFSSPENIRFWLFSAKFTKGKKASTKPWLWRSWHSSRSRHHRSAVRVPTLAKKYIVPKKLFVCQ